MDASCITNYKIAYIERERERNIEKWEREREQCKPLPSVLTGGKAVYLKYQKEPVSKEIILVGLKKFFKNNSNTKA